MTKSPALGVGYHGFLAVDGRARAVGDDLVDAFLVDGRVAFCQTHTRGSGETDGGGGVRPSHPRALLTSALVALLVETPAGKKAQPLHINGLGQNKCVAK